MKFSKVGLFLLKISAKYYLPVLNWSRIAPMSSSYSRPFLTGLKKVSQGFAISEKILKKFWKICSVIFMWSVLDMKLSRDLRVGGLDQLVGQSDGQNQWWLITVISWLNQTMTNLWLIRKFENKRVNPRFCIFLKFIKIGSFGNWPCECI